MIRRRFIFKRILNFKRLTWIKDCDGALAGRVMEEILYPGLLFALDGQSSGLMGFRQAPLEQPTNNQ